LRVLSAPRGKGGLVLGGDDAEVSLAKGGVGSVLGRPQAAFEPLSFLRFRKRGDGGDDERDADEGPFFHQHVSEAFRDALSF